MNFSQLGVLALIADLAERQSEHRHEDVAALIRLGCRDDKFREQDVVAKMTAVAPLDMRVDILRVARALGVG